MALLHPARPRPLHDNSFKLTIQAGFVQACCAGRHWTGDGDAGRDHRNCSADRTEKFEFAHISFPPLYILAKPTRQRFVPNETHEI